MAGVDETEVRLKDGVSGPAKRAETALDRLLRTFPRLDKTVGAAARGIQGTFGGLASTIKNVFARPLGVIGTSLSTMLGNLGADLVRFGINAAKTAAGGLVKMVDSAADARRSLTAAFGSLERGNEALLASRKILADMGGGLETLDQIRDTFRTMGRMGFSPAEADMVSRFRFDLEGLGVAGEKADTVIQRLMRAGATGTLNMRVLGELGEAGFNRQEVEEGVAKRMGLTMKQFSKLGEDDTIQFGTVMSELLQQSVNKSKKKLGEVGAAVGSYTLGGLAEDVKGKIVARIEQALDTSGSGSRIITAAGALAEKIGAAIESGKLDEWLTNVTGKLEQWGQKLDGFDVSKFIDDIGSIAKAVGDLVSSVKTLIGWLDSPVLSFLTGKAAVDVAGAAIFAASDAYENVAAKVRAAATGDDETQRALYGVGKASADGIAAGLSGGAPAVTTAASALAGSAADASAAKLKIHSPSRVFFEQGEEIDAGLAEGMTYNDLALQSAEDVARGVARTGATTARAEKPNYVGMGKEAARAMAAAGAGAGGVVTIGDVTIEVTGAGDPHATAELVYSTFEERIGSYLDRLLQGSGA